MDVLTSVSLYAFPPTASLHLGFLIEISQSKTNSVLNNTTDTVETLTCERNDTATPQNTVSKHKFTYYSTTDNTHKTYDTLHY